MNWFLAIIATVVSYTLFSYFGLRTGAASTFQQALLAPVSSIINFGLILVGSAGFGVATYYALKSSPFAITAVISIGLVVSFVFSSLFADGRVTVTRLLGLVVIVAGVWLLK